MKLRWMSALMIVALVGWVGACVGPAGSRSRACPSAGGAAGKDDRGQGQGVVDQAKKQVTLEDGTTLTILRRFRSRGRASSPGRR